MTSEAKPLVIFDGLCNLCDRSVHFLIHHDTRRNLTFASSQSDAARERLADTGFNPDTVASIICIDEGRIYTKSDAALRITRYLDAPFHLLAALAIIPAALRNPCYDVIAKNRYRFFGKRESCALPKPGDADRFV